MCLWATWSVPLSSLTLYVVHSGLKVYISLTCSLSLFLWATWFLIHVFTIEQPKCVLLSDLICTIEQVDFEIFSGLNMYIWATFTTCRLLTNEQSECVLLERSLYIWAVWLFTFERPDYGHLSGLTMCLWVACVPLSGLVRCTARGCLPLMVDLVLPNLNPIDVIVPQLVG